MNYGARLVTTDKEIRYQQNISVRKIAIVVLGRSRWNLVRLRLSEIAATVSPAKPGRSEHS